MSNHDEPLHPAEALAQALNRAEAAEAELRETKVELENAHATINRLNIQLATERHENAQLREIVFKLRDAKEAQAG